MQINFLRSIKKIFVKVYKDHHREQPVFIDIHKSNLKPGIIPSVIDKTDLDPTAGRLVVEPHLRTFFLNGVGNKVNDTELASATVNSHLVEHDRPLESFHFLGLGTQDGNLGTIHVFEITDRDPECSTFHRL